MERGHESAKKTFMRRRSRSSNEQQKHTTHGISLQHRIDLHSVHTHSLLFSPLNDMMQSMRLGYHTALGVGR